MTGRSFPATPAQQRLLRFIWGYELTNGVSPTLAECAKALGINSPGNVFQMLRQLEEREKIRRVKGRPRSIEVLDPPAIPMIDGKPLYFVLPARRNGKTWARTTAAAMVP